jgi:hypothetical protein
MSKTNKTKYIPFRVSEDDYTRLLAAAGEMSVSAYIRARLFDEDMKAARKKNKIPQAEQKILAKMLCEFGKSRLSQNINQIAKAVHSGMVLMPDEAVTVLTKTQAEINALRTALLSALGKKGTS